MAERDGAAIDVDARRVKTSEFDYAERLRGEGFVQLDDVNLIERETGNFQRLGNCIDGADTHFLRRAAGGGESEKSRERFCIERAGAFGAHDHRSSGAIA